MKEILQQRRQRLSRLIQSGVAIIPTAPEKIRNRDAHYPYRADSYFHYLTGFNEPEAIVVISGLEGGRSILFCREKNEEREIWDGFRFGPEAAKSEFGFDEAYSIESIDQILPELLGDIDQIFTPVGTGDSWDSRIFNWLNTTRQRTREGINAPDRLVDVRSILDEMRLIKDSVEQDTMRAAASISSQAHILAMKMTQPGKFEYEIEAELLYHFKKNGSQYPAYTSIVAGGKNACVLHYIENNSVLNDGELLLIDAGCELDGYASDITRTFPINGKFTGAQKELYGLVLDAQLAAIDQTRPGNSWDAPHEAAVRVLAQGFIDLKLCHGSLDQVLETRDYFKFYMHRTGHWLGKDVHDVGNYKINGGWRQLAPGMVLTVEPGCYIRESEEIPKEFWNIGIRIEDDALVTETGCEIITADTPKSVNDIEALMAA
jgi:Xaa-Pro aminopeptidase